MKILKTTLFINVVLLLVNCTTIVEGTSDFHPDFKIGKTGFEKELKKQLDFDDLAIGTYFTKKNNSLEERGLNLTFEFAEQELPNNQELNNYAEFIITKVKEYLLNLDNYDYVNTIFENEREEGNIAKSSRIKIKKKL
ncbi:hypothetical protein [Polaribacter sp.]|uniref:hypothetical protein n=1 Tax=Polaribacter sp. TaxID=1920175 RepID=UPI0025E00B86|nr:hypothetical protein [Polaribacter sp.]